MCILKNSYQTGRLTILAVKTGVLTSERFSRQIRVEKGEVIKDKASEVVGMLHLEVM